MADGALVRLRRQDVDLAQRVEGLLQREQAA
jgi:hypothetical protein